MAGRTPRPLVVGNWKMNGLVASLGEARAVLELLSATPVRCDVMICPPATLLHPMKQIAGRSGLRLGAQDCHASAQGAHTGDLSAEMLKNAGASAVIVGHSERRHDHGEGNAQVRAKAAAAHRAGLTAIVCVGETLSQRKGGQELKIVGQQLKGSLPATATCRNTVIAYEPVWAIGSGLTPSTDDVTRVHSYIRGRLDGLVPAEEATGTRILYGGSVKPDNCGELLSADNVDGALVGGASLKAADFGRIFGHYR